MSLFENTSGQRPSLTSKLKKLVLPAAMAVCLGISSFLIVKPSASTAAIGGETRTLSLYHVHTKESLTITYKVNGRYIPSALSKINYLLRDWRRNEVITIDPKTIDLMWELHADLGSTRPVHIICGYRSPKTNSFLKRIGRNVAKQSQHMVGKAIDLYFPDVATDKIRNSAMVREVGGVGYYGSSNTGGFVHIDSGHVRHWPRISNSMFAQIMRDGRRTVGARLNRGDQIMVASSSSSKTKEEPVDTAMYEGVDDETADAPATKPAAKAADDDKSAPVPRAKPAMAPPVELVKTYPVPLPRPKPIEVLMMAAANMKIEPASAPAPRINFISKPSPAADSLGVVAGGESMVEEPDYSHTSTNVAAKGSFADSLRDGTAEGTPLIKPLTASVESEDVLWWPKRLLFSPDQAVRRDGVPQDFVGEESANSNDVQEAAPAPRATSLASVMISQANAAPALSATTVGAKGDMLEVNRSLKGSLLMRLPSPAGTVGVN